MVRVLFLGGLGRSGTTLIERILGELPGVCGLGEVVHLWRRDVLDDERCGCGERFSRCAFWREVGIEAFGGWNADLALRVIGLRDAIERTRYLPELAAPRLRTVRARLVAEYTEAYLRIYRAAATVADASVVVDSSKHASLAFCLRWQRDVDLRVVHVVRDPRGVAYSWTRTRVRPEADGSAEMTRYPPARSALLWNAHNAAFGVLERLGTPVHRVRYEQFVAAPAAAVEEIRRFADLPPQPRPPEFLTDRGARLGRCHSAAGNPMRFLTGDIELRCDDAWRAELPAPSRRLVGALTAPLLGAYGYSLGTVRRPVPAGASR
ncbi:sulfotransferase family protein [Actinocatenispora comari]|uniref:sulfotransferase n=1 Tax=Actinocatenispora comari TaxID=2807577 RepID=UPI001A932242|nr:sulfotransferase [Actinocatenispora comari]